MLRRMKSDILVGLPEKRQITLPAEMPPAQAQAYADARLTAQGGGRGHGDMLRAIHAFRGISLHPDGTDAVDPFDEASVRNWIGRSARLAQSVSVLETISKEGEKALVFLEDLAMQKIFASAMATHFSLAAPPAIINGGVPGEKRLAIVEAFQNADDGFGLLVLSPKAAGIGLTITAANHVIHLSRWWNPAVEDQCNDRCYRIGQVRPVTVHVPLAVHPVFGEASFDVTLDRLLERKRALSRDMLMPPVDDGDVELLFGEALGPS
jgi:SNF2 family DNA or RNA helicase